MSINTVTVSNTNTTVYTSNGTSAITSLSLCNHSAAIVTFSVNIVPFGDTVGNGNIMLKSIPVPPSDTYLLYAAGEKLLLDGGDFISVIADVPSSVTSITSFTGI